MRGSQRARELGGKKERDIGNELKFKKMNSWKANLKFSSKSWLASTPLASMMRKPELFSSHNHVQLQVRLKYM